MTRIELENLLTENIPDLGDKELWIWGIGNTACLYQEGLHRIDLGSKIVGYVDSDEAKWKGGGYFYEKPVISPLALREYTNICVLICAGQPKVISEIENGLSKMGIEAYFLDEVILKTYSADVLTCYDVLDDDTSKEIYVELVKSRLEGKYPNLGIYSDNQYFVWNELTSKDTGEVFIDCGAYVGDTIEKYIWYKGGVFKRIIGIEPDPCNFSALEQRIKRLYTEWNIDKQAVSILNCSVADQTGINRIQRSLNGYSTKIAAYEEEGVETKITALDDLLREPYSFLKADIESFEYKMLLGAQKGIRLWKPHLAICIYHNAVDLFSIALFIHSLVPEYKIAIRHHTNNWSETVLYAWIE